MDGFFTIFKKAVSELICTRLYIMYIAVKSNSIYGGLFKDAQYKKFVKMYLSNNIRYLNSKLIKIHHIVYVHTLGKSLERHVCNLMNTFVKCIMYGD